MNEAPSSPLIELTDLTKVYRVGVEQIHALRGINLSISRNEFVGIMGPSGSGKSTLLNILGCLDIPTKGAYRLAGKDVGRMSQSALARVRGAQIGFVFQTFELLPRATAIGNVQLPLVYAGERRKRAKALEALERVGLGDRVHHTPSQLSGGQRQRVAVARALVRNPAILLADEPTGNLDTRTGNEILELFESLQRAGQTIIVVTHELTVADRCQRVLRLRDGLVESDRARC